MKNLDIIETSQFKAVLFKDQLYIEYMLELLCTTLHNNNNNNNNFEKISEKWFFLVFIRILHFFLFWYEKSMEFLQ